jgi:hypothetical protein
MNSQVWSWIGMAAVTLGGLWLLWKIIRIELSRSIRPTQKNIISSDEIIREFAEKEASRVREILERQLAALDSLAISFGKFTKGQDQWMRKVFGGDGGGYTEMDDSAAELRERASALQQRYKDLSWDEAMDRAKKMVVYDPDAKMRAQV